MKAKTRKRLLISSIAMLLVAMLALGTATFAWFSQNSKASASGIGAKTTQASNILVSETGANGTWGNKINFQTYANGDNTPVTPGADITNPVWKTTTSDGIDLGVKGSADYTTPTANADYTATTLYVKYDAESTESQPVDISFNYSTNTGTENFLRVALVPKNSAATALFSTAQVYGTAKDDFAKDPTKFTALDATNTNGQYSLVNNETKTMFSNISLVGGTEYSFDVYVWYEGTDPQCIDSNANTNYVVNFEVAKHA